MATTMPPPPDGVNYTAGHLHFQLDAYPSPEKLEAICSWALGVIPAGASVTEWFIESGKGPLIPRPGGVFMRLNWSFRRPPDTVVDGA